MTIPPDPVRGDAPGDPDGARAPAARDAWFAWIRASVAAAGAVPIGVFLLHVVLSRVVGAYEPLPGLDLPMHLAGGAAIAHFFRAAVARDEARPVLGAPSAAGRVVLTLALVASAAVVWEFAEWTGDRFGLTDAQAGLDDTMLDLFLGLVGGASYLVLRERVGAASRNGTERRRLG